VQDPRAAVGDHHCKPPKREACGASAIAPATHRPATSDQLPDEDVDEVLAERPATQGHDEEHRAFDLKKQIGSDEQPRPSTECLSNRNRHKKTDKHQPDK
jgi:hypothetical protein